MVNRRSPLGQLGQGHAQRPQTPLGFQTIAAIISYYFPRKNIHDQREVHKSLVRANVRQIANPNLVRKARLHMADEVGPYPKTMAAVRRHNPTATPGNQQITLAKQPEQAIPPYRHAKLDQLCCKQALEFARADSGVKATLTLNQGHNQFFINLPAAAKPPLLVKGLAAETHQRAKPLQR